MSDDWHVTGDSPYLLKNYNKVPVQGNYATLVRTLGRMLEIT